MESTQEITIVFKDKDVQPITISNVKSSGFDQMGTMKVENTDLKTWGFPLNNIQYFTVEDNRISVIAQFPPKSN